jgi:hypothetical protein
MIPFSTVILGAQITLAAADRVPTFNVEPSCRVAGNFGGDLRRDACLRTEKEARAQIVKDWNGFVVVDRDRCVETASMGGASRSYVELLTCLELARGVRKLPKNEEDINNSGTSPLEIDARPQEATRSRASSRRVKQRRLRGALWCVVDQPGWAYRQLV